MRVNITGFKVRSIISNLRGKENDTSVSTIHGATVEGHERIPFMNTVSVKTGDEPLVYLPAGRYNCGVNSNPHRIAKLTHQEPTQVYDMEYVHDPNRHFACQDHYKALHTQGQLETMLTNNPYYFSFVATDLESNKVLFEKTETE